MDLRPRAGLAIRSVEGERVILDRERGLVHQLNSTASLVWDSLTDGKSASEIVLLLTERFEVSEDDALADVVRVVNELRALDLFASPAEGSATGERDDHA